VFILENGFVKDMETCWSSILHLIAYLACVNGDPPYKEIAYSRIVPVPGYGGRALMIILGIHACTARILIRASIVILLPLFA
jgi:hypothetical protein